MTRIGGAYVKYWHAGMDHQARIFHDACISLHWPMHVNDWEDPDEIGEALRDWTARNAPHFQWVLSDDDPLLYWNRRSRP